MTLKKFNELLTKAKKATYEMIAEDPIRIEGSEAFFEGYFMMSLLTENLRTKDDYLNVKANKAMDAWMEACQEIGHFKYTQNYIDIIKKDNKDED